MSKKCPQCESKDIHITEYPSPNDSMATCYGCGYVGLVEQFPEQSLFDRITESPEVLAGKLVYITVTAWGETVFISTIIRDVMFRTREEAIAATVAKLKEVENG